MYQAAITIFGSQYKDPAVSCPVDTCPHSLQIQVAFCVRRATVSDFEYSENYGPNHPSSRILETVVLDQLYKRQTDHHLGAFDQRQTFLSSAEIKSGN